jgi:hypothetical protein
VPLPHACVLVDVPAALQMLTVCRLAQVRTFGVHVRSTQVPLTHDWFVPQLSTVVAEPFALQSLTLSPSHTRLFGEQT